MLKFGTLVLNDTKQTRLMMDVNYRDIILIFH